MWFVVLDLGCCKRLTQRALLVFVWILGVAFARGWMNWGFVLDWECDDLCQAEAKKAASKGDKKWEEEKWEYEEKWDEWKDWKEEEEWKEARGKFLRCHGGLQLGGFLRL